MERVARVGRVRGPLLIALACALLSAGAATLRVHAHAVTPAVAGHPGAAPLMKLLSAFDVFSFWSVLQLAFGLAAAAQLPRARALTGTLAAWLCLQLVTHVGMGGS